jgi:uncharacterized protein YegJ (DUF2314 family)
MANKKIEPTYSVTSTDEEMQAAMDLARARFPEFIRELSLDSRRAIPVLETAIVKAYFADADSTANGEHMWVSDVEWDGERITGVLTSRPRHVASVEAGEEVDLPLERLSDWLYVVDGKAHGAFTVQLLRKRMSEAEKKEHDKHYPFKFE